jgi:prepilin-type N-terminal cleavage/methylation domain-containing protein
MQCKNKQKGFTPPLGGAGFTLVELLVALIVTSIVLSAVVTLAYALGRANETSNDMSQKQAQLRYATLRISDLIRYSKLICRINECDLAIWRADDNGDGHINAPELVYIETGSGKDYIRLVEFPADSNGLISPVSIQDGSARTWLKTLCQERYTVMVPQCSNVAFSVDDQPLKTRFATVSFDLKENGVINHYQIGSALRSWAGYLLDGNNIVSDDD